MMTFRRHNHGSREESRPVCEDPPERCGDCKRPVRDVFYRVALTLARGKNRPAGFKTADLCPPCALGRPGPMGAYEKFVKAPFSQVFRKVEG